MYTEFFKLRVKPFDLVPNPEFLYLSKAHRKALSFLEYGLNSSAGFILLTGDIGSGKTTIIRSLLDRLESKTVPARIFNTKADAKQLLFMINEDFGLCTQPKDKMAMLSDLNEFLVQKFANNEKPVLIIDEAQNLSPDCLEEVRLLSNLESNDTKLLQIILVGQPELKTVIAQPGLQQLRQRISVDCHLGVLSSDETREYFFHRLECAGNVNACVLPDDCFALVHKVSGGVPRLINILGDYLLLAAFSEGTKAPDFEMVIEVIDDLSGHIAFYDVNKSGSLDHSSSSGVPTHLVGSGSMANEFSDDIVQDVSEETLPRLQRHEKILKKVIKKQIAQSLATQLRLEEICVSLNFIEERLNHLSPSTFATLNTKKKASRVSMRNFTRLHKKKDES